MDKMCFKDYIKCEDLDKVRKKMNKKSHKGRHYGFDQPDAMNISTASDGMAESIEADRFQFLPQIVWGHHEKTNDGKFKQRGVHYVNGPDDHRFDQAEENEETAENPTNEPPMKGKIRITRLNDDGRFPNKDEMNGEETDENDDTPSDPDRQGLIRVVKGAHLVYKRQSESANTYKELWVYKISDHNELKNSLSIRRDILSGTDIPPNSTKSDNGEQTSDTWTVGDIQFLEINGLPN